MKTVKVLTAAMIALGLSTVTHAASVATSEKQAEAAVEYRQSLYQLVKSNASPMFGMAKGALPYDAAVMKTNATRLEQLADMMADYLLVDTTQFDVSTDALPALFTNEADVLAKIADFKQAASGIKAAAMSGDESRYKNAIGALGGSCKSCHDDYKD
ncbi:c-type cytochrome [Alteromonas gilva]|uniref:Cytochrome c n=1 Tax=Alteromonas gilva TaxID=2987522 RepID=A0ABT5L7C0_9ALTE|nr:cytochrome c [Alteromonas gilva]MDC8831712.1 cytochrome c [Alteromonas gilva]